MSAKIHVAVISVFDTLNAPHSAPCFCPVVQHAAVFIKVCRFMSYFRCMQGIAHATSCSSWSSGFDIITMSMPLFSHVEYEHRICSPICIMEVVFSSAFHRVQTYRAPKSVPYSELTAAMLS